VCLTKDLISTIKLDYELVPADFKSALSSDIKCFDLAALIPESQVTFDSNESILNIHIPQYYLQKTARGAVSSDLWDNGIPALVLGYNFNAYNSKSYGHESSSAFASLSAGFNINGWSFKQNGNFSWSEDNGSDYTSLNAFAQKAIPDWKANLVIGQNSTQGELFDTLPFTGIRLSSDDRMLPSSQRGYAPEIHGVAKTTAKVSVRQNDRVIYETTVSPGPFLINDLYPTGLGGDLQVTVEEADGSQQNFSVTFTAMSQLLRPDLSQYSATIGQYRNGSLLTAPAFFEGTYRRGLTNSFTGYAGVQLNQDYYSAQAGVALGTKLGAFSFDVTHAKVDLENSESSGESYQFRYSKNITSTGSNLSLAAFRYSTEGYMDFQTAMTVRDAELRGLDPYSVARTKNRLSLTASQRLKGNWGQLYISSSVEDYWQQDGKNNQYQIGYNNRYKQMSWGFSANRTTSRYGEPQTNFQLNFNIPLGQYNYGGPQLRVNLSESAGNSRQQISMSDTFGNDNQFNYGVTASNSDDNGATGDLNLGYVSPYSSLNSNFSKGENYRSASVGASGSLVAHSGGVTLTPYTGTTFALVKAKGAEGAKVSGYSSATIDSNGYAIAPSMTPYQVNQVAINPANSSNTIEYLNTAAQVIPTADSVVLVEFETKQGLPLLIYSKYNGETLPFGAEVFDENKQQLGFVGQGGQVFGRVAETKGRLFIKWGDTRSQQCQIPYKLDESELDETLNRLDVKCEE